MLFSLANSMDQFRVSVSLVPILVMSGFVLLCWLLLGFVLRRWAKAGLIVSLPLLLFFSYEAFYEGTAQCWCLSGSQDGQGRQGSHATICVLAVRCRD